MKSRLLVPIAIAALVAVMNVSTRAQSDPKPLAFPKDEPARATGSLGCPVDDRGCRIMALGTVSPQQLAGSVGYNIGRQVIDRTGLAETYYFGDLKWAGDTSPDSPLPSLPSLLKERCGLELKADTGPVDTLVIDHAEKPTGN